MTTSLIRYIHRTASSGRRITVAWQFDGPDAILYGATIWRPHPVRPETFRKSANRAFAVLRLVSNPVRVALELGEDAPSINKQIRRALMEFGCQGDREVVASQEASESFVPIDEATEAALASWTQMRVWASSLNAAFDLFKQAYEGRPGIDRIICTGGRIHVTCSETASVPEVYMGYLVTTRRVPTIEPDIKRSSGGSGPQVRRAAPAPGMDRQYEKPQPVSPPPAAPANKPWSLMDWLRGKN